ncbi:terminase small subunit [Dethiosulfovibrio salsuginis]|uniref:Phage terminase small subunit n=1 Tax=Dethiosulfovibrio salsuginis TaxID=561720 RepID=A0A1X7LC96_9BACT|nr:terminase small subunit [Dethiosulfovibrio salsuginis]SMG51466.1 phage terminase small subunit [Dethiosulfovibrio salsuginis]
MAKKLTAKQAAFVEEYLVDLNATAAAKRAGYSVKTADRIGAELLGKTWVAAEIQKALKSRARRVEVTQDQVVIELAKIAFGSTRDMMEWGPGGVRLRPSSELTPDQAAMVAEVSETTSQNGGSLRLKVHDKVRALELLGKHLGMFVERKEITGRDGGPIEHNQKIDLSILSDEELNILENALGKSR